MQQNENVGGVSVDAEIDLRKINESGKQLQGALGKLEPALKKTEKGLKQVETAAGQTAGRFGFLKNQWAQFTAGLLGANVITRAVSFFQNWGKSAIQASSDLTELDSKARVVFGESFPAVQQEVRGIAKEVGRASSAILQMSTDLGAIISSFGITGPLMDQMSTQLAKLAVDMASFSNATDEEAFNALRSGITGETEPLKRFGIVLTDTNLKLFALEKGIKTKVEAMNQGQKTALRYAYIMEKTSLSQGDAARTAESFANKSKTLAGEWKTLNEELGKGVTPALAVALGVLTHALQDMREAIQKLMQSWKDFFALISFGFKPGANIDPSTGKPKSGTIPGFDPSTGRSLANNDWTGGAGSLEGEQWRLDKKQQEILSGIDSMKGAVAPGAGGAKDTAEEIERAGKALMQALDEQAKANLENVELRKQELELRKKLGLLTAKEETELGRINRRLAFKTDAIEDATKAWEEQIQAIEKAEERVKDLTESINEERQSLKEANAEIEKDAQRSREEKAADLITERNRLNKKLELREGLSREEQDRLAEIEATLKTVSPGTVASGESIAGMNEFDLINREAELKRKDAEEKANARIAELQADLDAENQKLEALRAAEIEKKQIVIDALNERQAVTESNFAAIEARTTAHVNQQIGEFNKLKATLDALSAANANVSSFEQRVGNSLLPGFARGGPIVGPGTDTSDSIVARLSHNEHVFTAKDVRAMGGQAAVIDFRRALHLPRFAEGGPVTHNNQKTASISIVNHGRAAEVYADPRRARWHAKKFLG